MFRNRRPRWLASLFILLLLLSASSSTPATVSAAANGGGTYVALTCNQSDVNAVINGPIHTAVDGDVIQIPAGTCTWTNGIVVPAGIGITIIGAGTTDPYNPSGDGTDTTTIIDCYNNSGTCNGNKASWLFYFTPAYGASLSRISSMTLTPQPGLSAYSLNAPIAFEGTCTVAGCPYVRVDDIVFPSSPSWGGLTAPSNTMIVTDNVFGVLDHNSAYLDDPSSLYEFVNFNHSSWQGVGQYGDNSWAASDTFGTDQALYVETNHFELHRGNLFPITEAEGSILGQIGEGGGRVVCRFNTAIGLRSMCANHGTESNGRPRGGRQMEFYDNSMSCPNSSYPACWNNGMLAGPAIRSGSLLALNNAYTGKGMNSFATLSEYRALQSIGPFGPCDGSGQWDDNDGVTYYSGTISSVSGSNPYVITVTGSPGWSTNEWVSNSGAPWSVHDATINNGSEITASGSNTLTVKAWTTIPYAVNDSIQILRATACIDQSSRIQGSLLSGVLPSLTNAVLGYVYQTSDPVYQAGDTSDKGNPSFGSVGASTARIMANRDYYGEVSQSAQTSSASPFNGTVGTGYGTLANLPTTCTPGVGYWATDQGTWNTSGNGGQGQLFVCTVASVWALYYTPYVYPHPLTISAPTAPTIPTQPASQTIGSGSTVNLTVGATGSAPFTYQWYQGLSGDTSTPVGTNSSSFTTPALTTTTSYWVNVTNNVSSVVSSTATIAVIPAVAPGIGTQPASQTIANGASAILNVVATGTAPFTYQWYQGTSGTTTTPVGPNSSSFTTPALTTATSYWVQVSNSAGNISSSTATVTVATVSTVPTVSITSPLNKMTVSGTAVNLSTSVSAGIVSVQFSVDGTNVGSPVSVSPFSMTWDTTTVSNGSHTITAAAQDGSGTIAWASVTVTVSNAISLAVSITQPGNGATVFGTTPISASVTNNMSVSSVQFQLDGVNLGAPVPIPYSMNWNTTLTINGKHYLTAIVTDNNGHTANSASIAVTVNNVVATLTYNLSGIAGMSVSTSGSTSSMQEYDAFIQQNQPGANSPIGGVAIIGYRPNGVLVSETGVPASPQITSGRMYTEISNTVNTGLAMANVGSTDATVNFYFTDSTGNDYDFGSMTLQANHQVVAFLNQNPFNGPTGTFQGSFTFTSNAPIGVIALRTFVNERGETLFTTLPVAPVGIAPTANVLPQFADGPGWTTSVLLTNVSDSLEAGTIQFFGQGSGAQTAPLANMTVNGTSGTTFNYVIPAHSSARFDTSGLESSLQVGSIVVTPYSSGTSNDLPSAVSLVQLRQNGITISNTTFIAAPTGDNFQLYVEASGTAGQPGSVQSGLVIANPSAEPVAAYISLYNINGTPTNLPTATIMVPPGGQISRFMNQVMGVPASFQGVANLSTSAPVYVIALRGNYNERGDFLMTTTPPVNDAYTPSGNLVLPQIVSGEGFSTQIVVFGANAGTGELYMMSSDGLLQANGTVQ